MPRPSPSYQEALAWLYGTQLFGIKLGLENIQRLLRELDLPGKEQRFVHVAGTNGKGSVCAMIEAVCRAQGYRTGLFISPHLVTYRERIRVDGEMITAEEVAEGLMAIRQLVGDWDPHPTFFEITTALALMHFKKCGCEVVAFETGLGGRLDATSAVEPVVSVITPIGYDHQAWLGNTLEEIASEKAGIIKTGVPIVSAPQEPEAEEVLRARARVCEAPLEIVRDSYAKTPVSLAGVHQKRNASLAIAALHTARISIGEEAIACGLANVHWPARFQRWDERIIIDGAHNPAGARILAQTWHEVFADEGGTLILAVLNDKDAAGICQALAPISVSAILPKIRSERALPPEELARTLSATNPSLHYSIASSLDDALDQARTHNGRILITGSLHFAGEALATLSGDPAAFEECSQ